MATVLNRPRRLVITEPHVISVETFEPAALQPNELRVRSEFASGKHGTTQAMFDGRNFRGQRFDPDLRMFLADDAPPATSSGRPNVFGTTAVGMVEEVGTEVAGFSPGDRVVGLMPVASQNIVSDRRVWHLGDADPLEALSIEPAYVAIHAVRESNLRFGDTVAVFGLGAIGLVAVEMARRAGASQIFAIDPLANRRAWAVAHGADAALDPTADDAALRIHELTRGKGVDVAIEAAGSHAALAAALKSARIGGTVCAAGFYQGEASGLWLGREFHHNRLQMIVPHGCGWGHEPRDYPRWDEWRTYQTIVEMLQKGRLDLSGLIQPLVSLEQAPDTWRRIEDDPGSVIKLGVKF